MKNPNEDPSRPRLSVAMIVRNEEDLLADSIESVRAVADEIVILDTGSTDKTIAVARRMGVKLGKMPWADDFSAARNECLQLATGDWVLWLDAGERLTEDSAVELRAFLDAQPERKKVYSLWIEMPARDRVGSAEQILQPRLMPGGAGVRFEGRIRETLDRSVRALGMSVAAAPGRIVKHARQHDLERSCNRAERDLSLALMEARELGETPARLLLVAGESYSVFGAQERACVSFREAIRTAERGSREMLEAYYGLLAAMDGDTRVETDRLGYCREALEIFPQDIQLLMVMGNQLLASNRLDLAIRSFEAAVQIGEVTPEVWHLITVREVAAACLGLALQACGRDEEACRVLKAALGAWPESLALKNHLFNLHVKLGNTQETIALADQMPHDDHQREPLRNAIRGACKAARQEWREALGYLQVAYVSGCNSPFCLRWLAVTLLSNGKVDAARPILLEWRSVEPDNAELHTYLDAVAQLDQDTAATGEIGDVRSAKRSASQHLRIDRVEDSSDGVPPPAAVVSPHGIETRKV